MSFQKLSVQVYYPHDVHDVDEHRNCVCMLSNKRRTLTSNKGETPVPKTPCKH